MQAQEFEYEQFFAANDISWPCVVRAATDDDDDEPIDDLPPPAWFRRREERDPFPPCDALLCWPSNYPVEGDADLSEAEAAEVDPARFRYSEPEMEAWRAFVEEVLVEVTSPAPPVETARPLPVGPEKRHAPRRASEVIQMQAQTYQHQQPTARPQPAVRRDPPVARFSAGGVTVSAWSNPAPSGGHYYTFSIDRRYRSQDGLRNTKSLRLNDLPLAAALMQKAFSELALGAREAEPPMVGGSLGRLNGTDYANEVASIDNESAGIEG